MNNSDLLGSGPDPFLKRELLHKLRDKYDENVNISYKKLKKKKMKPKVKLSPLKHELKNELKPEQNDIPISNYLDNLKKDLQIKREYKRHSPTIEKRRAIIQKYKKEMEGAGPDPFLKRQLLKNIKEMKMENVEIKTPKMNKRKKKKLYLTSPLKKEVDTPISNYLEQLKIDLKILRGSPSVEKRNEIIARYKKGGSKVSIDSYHLDKQTHDKIKMKMENMKTSPLKHEIMKGSGKKRSQYYGKRSSVMVKVPQNVKNTALYAFKLKKIGFKGALETGWKRAHQLSTKESIPIEDVRFMRNWFARHIYTSYPGYKKWLQAGRPKDSSWHNKHAIQSWLTWAGNSGFDWINSQKIINLLNKHYNKDYKPLKKK